MIAFFLTILVCAALTQGMLFYYLNQRLESLINRVLSLNKEMETLYANQRVLEADMKKVYNDFQSYKKEITQIQQQRRTEKTHAV